MVSQSKSGEATTHATSFHTGTSVQRIDAMNGRRWYYKGMMTPFPQLDY